MDFHVIFHLDVFLLVEILLQQQVTNTRAVAKKFYSLGLYEFMSVLVSK